MKIKYNITVKGWRNVEAESREDALSIVTLECKELYDEANLDIKNGGIKSFEIKEAK